VRLDSTGWQQVSNAVGRLLDELQRIEAAAAKRLERHPHREEPTNASIVMLAFDAIRLTGDGAASLDRDGRSRSREHSTQR
jgi:hypothetical protein